METSQEKTIGLIGKTKITSVYFETRFGIHTFGMKKPIDVFILDSDNKIVKIQKNLKPNNVFFWNPKYYRVIETPKAFLKVKLGDIVQLSFP